LAVLEACGPLRAEQQRLADAFAERARAFAPVIKVGRTQLQDAVPMTLGMEFAGFAATMEEDIARLGELATLLREVNLGGTAIGTGVTTPSGYAALAVRHLAAISGEPLVEARDRIEASSDLGAFVTVSGVLKRIAVKLSKICNDLRLLSSGPRAGLGEIHLPPMQAGSSIMPGKVNPVIPEVVNQVAYQVIGNDLTATLAAEAGQLQLNAMEPVLIFNVLQSMRVLTRAMAVLTDRCIVGIEADTARCAALIENSLVLATALVPLVGYEAATAIAKRALATGRTIADVALEAGGLTREQLELALRAEAMLGPAAAPGADAVPVPAPPIDNRDAAASIDVRLPVTRS
jgi:aspartate ammonia-lyase